MPLQIMVFCICSTSKIKLTQPRNQVREWMKLPKDTRRTEGQVAAFAKGAVQQNGFQRSRRDPYQKVMGWLLPRIDRS